MKVSRLFLLIVVVSSVAFGTKKLFFGPKEEGIAPAYSAEVEQKLAEFESGALPSQDSSHIYGVSDDVDSDPFSAVDRTPELFSTSGEHLPIVKTVEFTSSVDWKPGKHAWIADYASHYGTSRHFIARSLNGKPDYNSQKVSNRAKFNVFNPDKEFQFYFVVDLSRRKMGFYYIDESTNEKVHLKTYDVGVGALDETSTSGSLTPIGIFKFGDRVASYKPGIMGYNHDEKIEMVQVFGTRWIPLSVEESETSFAGQGFGISGAPWVVHPITNELVENRKTVGSYSSGGCLRLFSEDVEEIYAIVLTKPTYIEIVKDYRDAKFFKEKVEEKS